MNNMSDRQRVVMHHEGQMLQIAAAHGNDAAAEHTRGIIDGCFNALIRMQGIDEASKFAFALSDRIVGGVKQPTTWPLPPPAAAARPVASAPEPIVTTPAAQAGGIHWPALGLGYALGASTVALLLVADWLGRFGIGGP